MTRRIPFLAAFFAVIFALVLHADPAAAATEKVLYSFVPYLNGLYPSTTISDAEGNLYVVAQGGAYNHGLILKFTLNAQGQATETVLHDFTGGSDGVGPVAITLDGAGNIYGLAYRSSLQPGGELFELTPSSHGEWNLTVLETFTMSGNLSPGIVEDNAGNFYGTSYDYGPTYGSVFQLTLGSGGWTQNVIHIFSGGSDGGFPYGRLTLDQSGNIYGTAEEGGPTNRGIVFEFSPSTGNTWTEKVLHNFTAGGNDGWEPSAALIFDSAGNLYSTTDNGGAPKCNKTGGCGTVFELSPSTGGQWTEQILYTFGNADEFDVQPQDIIFDSSGNIYGTTFEGGGELCCGSAFKLTFASGHWTGTILYTFTGFNREGYYPNNDIVLGPAGQIYGTTQYGGPTGLNGTVFELTPNGSGFTQTTLYGFPFADGDRPESGLVADASGNFYSTTLLGGGADVGSVFKLSPSGSESLLYSFSGKSDDGNNSVFPSSLILDSAGNLYGAAEETGSRQYGSVFELSPAAHGTYTEKNLDNLSGVIDHPLGNLIFDKSGNLYGTALDGGTNGFGAVLELIPQANGTFKQTVIYSFGGYPVDGAGPSAGLIFDGVGNLYGTTAHGGSSSSCKGALLKPIGCGIVFELMPVAGGWQEQMLHSFAGSTSDGAIPAGNLIMDANGDLYGTTTDGGLEPKACRAGSNNPAGCGTVYELSSSNGTWTETIIYEFTRANGDGGNPEAGLVEDPAGNLYGTTLFGGSTATYTYGTVYKLAPAAGGGWTESVLYSFTGTGGDGGWQYSNLILDAAGNLYGTASYGGNAGFGTVFEITP
ncbi:MAG: choice-of-anchor tandem repeat GloVer-containing protein [Candidatus Sulfotelmatobacter sp.]